MRQYTNFHDYVIERLHTPKEARLYLEIALEEYEKDGDHEAFLLALRTVAEAQGGLAKLAKRAGVTRQSLYKSLSSKGNPRLDTFGAILHGLGFKLAVVPREKR